jgi:hypothetical protein
MTRYLLAIALGAVSFVFLNCTVNPATDSPELGLSSLEAPRADPPTCSVLRDGPPPLLAMPPPFAAAVGRVDSAVNNYINRDCVDNRQLSTPRDVTCTFQADVENGRKKSIGYLPSDSINNVASQVLSGRCDILDQDGYRVGSYTFEREPPPTMTYKRRFNCFLICEGDLKGTLATAQPIGAPSFAGEGRAPGDLCREFQRQLSREGIDCSIAGAQNAWDGDIQSGGDTPWVMDGPPHDWTTMEDYFSSEYPTGRYRICRRMVQDWKVDDTRAMAACNRVLGTEMEQQAKCRTPPPGSVATYMGPWSVCVDPLPPVGDGGDVINPN